MEVEGELGEKFEIGAVEAREGLGIEVRLSRSLMNKGMKYELLIYWYMFICPSYPSFTTTTSDRPECPLEPAK